MADHHNEEASYDNRNSRLIGAVGKKALLKLQNSRILLQGLGGLGIEIAKNIVLMGVASLTLYDPEPVQIGDLSSQFFLSESDVGSNRAQASLTKLKELNERVQIDVHRGKLDNEFLSKFTVVVLTNNTSQNELLRINEFCHERKIAFIAGDVRGLFGWIFNDFNEYECIDPDGEPPATSFIENITQDKDGLVTLVDSKKNEFQDGDLVEIEGVEGMTELNGKNFKIKVTGPYNFTINTDTSSFEAYSRGGTVTQVKLPTKHQFKALSDFFGKSINFDEFIIPDMSKLDKGNEYNSFVQALLSFEQKYNHRTKPGSEDDAKEVVNTMKQILHTTNPDIKFEEKEEEYFIKLAKGSSGVLSPMATLFGGIIGQEIIKACSMKYMPIKQLFFLDSAEAIPDNLTEADCAPQYSRYDDQIAVFGKQFQEKVLNDRYFLIGAGAIGTEMLKCWAMIGAGCGKNGKIDVTDMDTIEISNLNRQFLYRERDVSSFKSDVAARVIKHMNPNMNIHSWRLAVGPDTEDQYNIKFWSDLDIICNALDNIKARLYVDSKCVFFQKPLLESGTQGTKGNTQIVVPHVTESYGSSVDPPSQETPVCLLHSFPNNIQHCLQWARELLFEGHFVKEAEVTNMYLNDPQNYVEGLNPVSKLPSLKILKKNLTNRVKSFEDCIVWARKRFEKYYVHKLKQLLYNFPADYRDTHGTPFWSGAKRPPTPLVYDPNNDLHLGFIVAATFLKAYTTGLIDKETKPSDLKQKIEYIKIHSGDIVVPEFQPRKGVKIVTDEKITKEKEAELQYTDEDEIKCQSIMKNLDSNIDKEKFKMNSVIFEKDDDSNFHIDFIHAAANLRASAYGIKTVKRLKSKLIAGKIIPAIVTTTACVVGLITLELYKLVAQKKNIEAYRNTFLNLAIPIFSQSEPMPPKKKKYLDKQFTQWERIDIRIGDATLQEVLKYLEKNYKIVVDMLAIGSSLVYTSFMMSKARERLPKKLTSLYEEISGQKLPEHQTYFMLEPSASDLDGNDIDDLPLVCYWYK